MIRPELLSDKEVLQETKGLVGRECHTTLTILFLLGEIEQRKLHVKLGYSSLFLYCTQHLRYSTSAAGRRVQVARCMRRFSGAHHNYSAPDVAPGSGAPATGTAAVCVRRGEFKHIGHSRTRS